MLKRILAVASGGGHWTQMMRLREALETYDVCYVGVKEMYRADVLPRRFDAVPDVSRLHKWSLLITTARLFFIIASVRPHIVITTGSGPGMLALRIGKLFGAKTVWIDSIANVGKMSLSGMKAGKYADLWLTQWPHLAREGGPSYKGSVL